MELKEVVSNSYSRAEPCVLLLRSQQPTVSIDFVLDEIWLVIASYEFARCQRVDTKLKPLGCERTSGLKEGEIAT